MAKKFQRVRGMNDILPQDQKYWKHVLGVAETQAIFSGFQKVSTPAIESAELFKRSVGGDTDIVGKEMYEFKDKSGAPIALKPEGTAPIVRAYLEGGMASWPQPVKLFYADWMFRYERPQAGRRRQFFQFGFEVLGEEESAADGELIGIAWQILEKLGLGQMHLAVNSIGCGDCRESYKKALLAYYKPKQKQLCGDCKVRFKENPLRLLDCKEKKDEKIRNEAPVMLDFLCVDCKAHFTETLEYLDELEIPYNLESRLVRGLDYYTRTVFEIWPQDLGSNFTLIAGGRYDDLVELLGGKKTPALGFAAGVDRIIEYIKEKKVPVTTEVIPKVFVVQLGQEAKKRAAKLLFDLRGQGISAEAALTKDNIGNQMKIADKFGVPIALILGQKEVMDKTVIIRDMNSGTQEEVRLQDVSEELQKRLPK